MEQTMKMQNVIPGMSVNVFDKSAVVDTMYLNDCIVKYIDGSTELVTYNLLMAPEGTETKTNNVNMKIAIIDIETTDFLQRGGKIVEIGIVELCLETGDRRIIFNEVCHEKGITREEVERSWIVANSDLTVEDVKNSRCLDKIRPEVQAIIDQYENGATAFNNAFDFTFMESRGFVFRKKLPCPMKISTDICKLPKKGGYGYKWPNVMEAHRHFFGDVGYIEKHRGADDAFHEAEIVHELYKLGLFPLN